MNFNLKPYPKYKEIKLPWLYTMPSHWKIDRAKYLFNEIDIRSKSGTEELLTVSSKKGVIKRSIANVTMFKAESYAGYKLCWHGDLVINSLWAWMRGLGFSKYHGIVSTAYGVYRLKPDYIEDFSFFDYLLRSEPYLWEHRVRSKGIWRSRYQLTDDSFMNMPIIIPPKDERKKIIAFLNNKNQKISRFIRNKQRLIELLKEQKQAIINQAVTRGINPNVKMKPSGVEWIGEIPEHWETVQLNKITTTIQTGPFGSQLHAHDYIKNGIPVINPKHIINGCIIPDENCSIRSEKSKVLTNHILEEGDLILARRGDIGRCALVTKSESGWLCGTGSIRVHLKNSYFKGNYFYQLMSSKKVSNYLSLFSVGSTMDNLNSTIIGNIKLPLPPINEQIQIINTVNLVVKKIDQTSGRTKQEIELIKEYRTRLISDVVTGKIDVRDIPIEDVDLDEIETVDEILEQDEELEEFENTVELQEA